MTRPTLPAQNAYAIAAIRFFEALEAGKSGAELDGVREECRAAKAALVGWGWGR